MTEPGWSSLVRAAFDDPAGVLQAVRTEELTLGDQRAGKVSLSFAVRDLRGEPYVAEAVLWLPAALLDDPQTTMPVWFGCGYQIAEPQVQRQLRRGRIVATSIDPEGEAVFPLANPLCRGPNTDYVLAHLVRGLAFVDPAAIIYSGGSAGGYAALLVAAEAFPAAAVVANAPVVNLAYQVAHLLANAPALAADPPADEPLMGVLMGLFLPFIDRGWRRAYGDDLDAAVWWDHSPMAHLDQISCPAAAFFSTADFLVAIEQVGVDVGREYLSQLPPGVVMAAADLTSAAAAQRRLVDELGERAAVRFVSVPEGAKRAHLSDIDLTMSRPQAPVAIDPGRQAQWTITVLDEGPTVFGIGHTKHLVEPNFETYLEDIVQTGLHTGQLTAEKLSQLLDRWDGREWLAPGYTHLDAATAERADVARGLRRYTTASPAHRARFNELYATLPDARRTLPPKLVVELAGSPDPVAL